MTTRRDFLRRTSLALAGGLIVGDAAMELFERLTWHRKSFPSSGILVRERYISSLLGSGVAGEFRQPFQRQLDYMTEKFRQHHPNVCDIQWTASKVEGRPAVIVELCGLTQRVRKSDA